MSNSEVIIHDSQIEPLRPILNSWLQVLQTYIDRTGDSPSLYRERPQVGFLSIAAWNCGWASLEEWGTTKGPQHEQSRGRNDLWIGLPKEKGQEWFIEAKHTWCDIGKNQECITKTLESARASADYSAAQLNCPPGFNKVAAVFVSPIWRSMDVNARVEWFNLCKQEKVDAITIFVPTKREGPNLNICEGSVALLLKLVA